MQAIPIMFFIIAMLFEVLTWIRGTSFVLPVLAFAFWTITGISIFLVYTTALSALMMTPFLIMSFVNIAKFYAYITDEDRW